MVSMESVRLRDFGVYVTCLGHASVECVRVERRQFVLRNIRGIKEISYVSVCMHDCVGYMYTKEYRKPN